MVTTDNGTAQATVTAEAEGAAKAATGTTKRRGWLVTLGTVVALVAAMGLTVLGLGMADNAVANYDVSSWMWSSAKSEVARVNGVTGRVDTRVEVAEARHHPVQVTQTDRFLLLRDLSTGQVSSLDLTTLQVTATTKTTAGLGVSVALHEDAAFVIDAVQGIVRQLDPTTLTPVGEPVRYPPGITGGAFDGAGRLWVAVPSEGTVSAVTPAKLDPTKGPTLAGAEGPSLVRTVPVAAPSHDLAVSTLDDGVAVLDRTTSTLTKVKSDHPKTLPLSLRGAGAVPPRTAGDDVPVTVPDERQVVVVGDTGPRTEFTVPGSGARLRPAVAWAGRFYCADEQDGTVYAFDGNGQLVEKIEHQGGRRPAGARGPRKPPVHQRPGRVDRAGRRRQARRAGGRQVRRRGARRRPAAGTPDASPGQAHRHQAGRAAGRHRQRRQRAGQGELAGGRRQRLRDRQVRGRGGPGSTGGGGRRPAVGARSPA